MDVKTYELTGEQIYMYGSQMAGFGIGCIMGGSMTVKGSCSNERMQHAANEVVRINDGLRTRVVKGEDGVPVQYVVPFEEREFKVMEFADADELDRFGAEWIDIPFEMDADHELFEMIIVQLPDSYGALFKIHHIISDAWTCMLVGDQFLRILNGETPKAYPFTDYVVKMRDYAETGRYKRDMEFFEAQKKELPQKTYVSPEPMLSAKKHWIEHELSDEEAGILKEYVKNGGSSEHNLFATAVCAWISRMIGKERFYIGVIAMNRSGYKEKNSVGQYASSIPLIVECDPKKSFADNAAKIGSAFFAGYRHQRTASGVYGYNDTPYDFWISYQNASLKSGIEARAKEYPSGQLGRILLLEIIDRGDGKITLLFEHNVKYSDKKAARLVKEVPAILMEGIRDSSRTIGDITDQVMGPESGLNRIRKWIR